MILTGVVVVAVLVYFYVTGGSTSSSSVVIPTPGSATIGADVFQILNQIQTLHIDNSLFQDSAWKSLRDNTVQIPSQNVGRANPFAPLPGEKIVSSPTPVPVKH